MSVKCNIRRCSAWGARKPKADAVFVPASKRIIFHHTAGHHPEILDPATESLAECEAFALTIQAQHIAQGWNDSGHNFLVCRNGFILEGRWFTAAAIEANRMVVSAHCPGQNDQIGIEHEHLGLEKMTKVQREASARLIAWIANQYGRKLVLPVFPHSKYFATACPANLIDDIPAIKLRAQQILDNER